MKKPKHKRIDECKDAFVMMYYKFYLGSSWPLPSVTKFTNVSIVSKKVQLAFAHHGILAVLVEPYEYSGDPLPSLLSTGSGLSDYQVVHRVRKHDIYEWAVCVPDTKWKSGILSVLCDVLDSLTYIAFCHDGKTVTMHGNLETVATAEERLLRLLEEWSDDASPLWVVLDAVSGVRRSECNSQIRAFMRKNLLQYACSMLRRYELPLLFNEKPMHDVSCDVCSPTVEAKDQAWGALSAKSPCCMPFVARRLVAWHSDALHQGRETVASILAVREDLQQRSTKVSESNHAHGQKLLGKSLKPLALATFATKVFLSRVQTDFCSRRRQPEVAPSARSRASTSSPSFACGGCDADVDRRGHRRSRWEWSAR